MRILCTFPGRSGDLLWALPTVRALAEAYGEPVDVAISEKYAAIRYLVAQQPYVGMLVVDPSWQVEETAPISPRIPPGLSTVDATVYHLGYAGWPAPTLPRDIYDRAFEQYHVTTGSDLPPLDLDRPWITVADPGPPTDLAVGFTDEYFELKYGLTAIVEGRLARLTLLALAPRESRWARERPAGGVPLLVCDWVQAAAAIRNADLFLGCCSALHVLACAIGRRVILVEPNAQRHHPVFYPYGQDGSRVTLVRGNDGRPTFDARHVGDALQTTLQER